MSLRAFANFALFADDVKDWTEIADVDTLGAIWWRLIQLAILWSGLLVLAPRYEPQEANRSRWLRWRQLFRSFTVASDSATSESIDFIGVGGRVARLERRQWAHEYDSEDDYNRIKLERRHSIGLHTSVLQGALGWLLADSVEIVRALTPEETTERGGLLRKLLAFEIWHHPRRDDHRDPLPTDLGYHALRAAAWLVPAADAENGRSLWRAVLQLDVDNHHFVEHFLSAFFGAVARDSEKASVVQYWREMLTFALDAEAWTESRYWYRREKHFRQLLGFGSEVFLNSVPEYQNAIAQMASLYERWAERYLGGDDDNVAGFCHFLTTPTGKLLRMVGLRWLHRAILSKPKERYWRRDGTGDMVIGFLYVVLNEEAALLSAEGRNAMLAITAQLVAVQLPAALALQEHARSVLRNIEPR